ncbi:isoprenylcysteine carboxylmethyltransferase family protein [Vibrio sp. Isolate24]|uniref:methyltransferase family protein n=1 Tax=Vibrio sp. Isolate24 TaxID=2908534 RepID=UPI001EFD16F9|nr:isoprenylcysteine carboxylmethyltransferase family protein [Vibrio sp. Isolate24]MCG9677578.1 isoprenylcysteine carboxylmethyltransferase family protein [Vibrio sp. Isolate24]
MKKLLPPKMFFLFIILMIFLHWYMETEDLIPYPLNLIGALLFCLGLGLASAGKRLFQKLKTNIMTFEEPNKIVTQGVFQYTRNPMYLGLAIALIGFAIMLGGSLMTLTIAASFIIMTDKWYIAFEEKEMMKKFGREYQEYCRHVRRWI